MVGRMQRIWNRAKFAAIGAAIGGGVGGLFSANAASTGAAVGAFVGALVGEKRASVSTIVADVRERTNELSPIPERA